MQCGHLQSFAILTGCSLQGHSARPLQTAAIHLATRSASGEWGEKSRVFVWSSGHVSFSTNKSVSELPSLVQLLPLAAAMALAQGTKSNRRVLKCVRSSMDICAILLFPIASMNTIVGFLLPASANTINQLWLLKRHTYTLRRRAEPIGRVLSDFVVEESWRKFA